MEDVRRVAVRNRKLGALCLLLGPLLMLLADGARALGGEGVFWAWSVGIWISFFFFIGAILALVDLLAPRVHRTALAVGAASLLGLMTAATMQGVFRSAQVSSAFAAEIAAGPPSPLMLTSIAPGILFPLSLVVFGLLLGGTRTAGWLVSLALVAGGVLFPLGRFIIGEIWINVGSDVLMLIALGSLAARQAPRTRLPAGGPSPEVRAAGATGA
jgi:hypothetical protein